MAATPGIRSEIAARVRHNLGIKLLSLVLALFLWAFVHGSAIVQRDIQVPVRYAHLADSLMFYEPPPSMLRVQVSGPLRDLLLHFGFTRKLEAVIDLSRARTQQFQVLPTVQNITPPANPRVNLERVVEPTVLELRLAMRRERAVPVRLVLNRGVPEGYVLVDSIRIEPPAVRVSGPSELVERLTEIHTESVELQRSRDPYTQEVALQYDSAHLTCSPERVSIEVPMARLRSRVLEQAVDVEPPLRRGLRASVDIQLARVTISGPEREIDALDPAFVRLWVDASRLQVGRHDSVAVHAELPDWAQLVAVTPPTIAAQVMPAEEAARPERTRP